MQDQPRESEPREEKLPCGCYSDGEEITATAFLCGEGHKQGDAVSHVRRLTEPQYRSLFKALDQLNALADDLGETWDDYEFDHLATARSLIREWVGSHGRQGLDG